MSPNSTTAPEISGMKETKSKDASWWKKIRAKSTGYKRLDTPNQPTTSGERHHQQKNPEEAPSDKITNSQDQEEGRGEAPQRRAVVVRQRRAPAVESRHPTYAHMREMQSNFLGGR